MKLVKVISAMTLLVSSSLVIAAEEEATSPWKSSAELGYVKTSGNSNTESTKAIFDISYEVEKWLQKGHAEAYSTTSETTDETTGLTADERTAARWLVSGQSNYKLDAFNYIFGLASYEEDRFSGFEYQAKLGVGYGRVVIHNDVHDLKLEVGPSYRTYKLEPTIPPALADDKVDEVLIRLYAGYLWNISKTAKFTEDFTAEFGEEQEELKSVSALTANINSTLAMRLSYTIKKLDKVPAGTADTDKEMTVTLVYSY